MISWRRMDVSEDKKNVLWSERFDADLRGEKRKMKIAFLDARDHSVEYYYHPLEYYSYSPTRIVQVHPTRLPSHDSSLMR